ncbi:COX15/CtaA family protein [Fictibacillus phosphorivorans]|uniref:COX15/CtaA family protein n=1 Tax=Fictibacillus phosphorivorans TaxID=1221500 RepID=UPI00203E9F1A|nr:heme A synthase [Fictibacillus phosphorivorans]MCM3774985.1 heme A synthase [Fictibacillus phosphorivorans]
MKRAYQLFSIITSFGMLLVLLMGAVVTKTDSGDGCGNSWPLCYGELLPTQPKLETIIEVSHRYVSAWLGILVIILAIWAWKRDPRKEVKILAVSAVFFIVLQGLLGAAAVIWSQSSAVLASHFGFSLVSFASVLLIALLSFEDRENPYTARVSAAFKKNLYWLFAYLYAVVYTGALVRHTGSSMGCGQEFPTCGGTITELGSQASIHFLHRMAAILLFVWIVYSWYHARKFYRNQTTLNKGLMYAALFALLQGVSGAMIVLSDLNLFVALSHGLIISFLFGTLSFVTLIIYRK